MSAGARRCEMRARRSFNTKRKLCPTSELPVDLSTLAARVGYGGEWQRRGELGGKDV